MKLATTILITVFGCLLIIPSTNMFAQTDSFDGSSKFKQSRSTNFNKGSQSIRINKAAQSYYRKAESKTKLKQYQEAVAAYNKVIELDPNHAAAYHNRGVIKYVNFKDKDGALADYNTAIQLNPNYAQAYTSRGSLKYGRIFIRL